MRPLSVLWGTYFQDSCGVTLRVSYITRHGSISPEPATLPTITPLLLPVPPAPPPTPRDLHSLWPTRLRDMHAPSRLPRSPAPCPCKKLPPQCPTIWNPTSKIHGNTTGQGLLQKMTRKRRLTTTLMIEPPQPFGLLSATYKNDHVVCII